MYPTLLPAHVRHDKNLTALSKILYSELYAEFNHVTEDYIIIIYSKYENLYEKSAKTIIRAFKCLERNNYIKIIDIDYLNIDKKRIYLIK